MLNEDKPDRCNNEPSLMLIFFNIEHRLAGNKLLIDAIERETPIGFSF